MNAQPSLRRLPLACGLLLVLLLTACERPMPPGDTPAPVAPPEPEAAAPAEAPPAAAGSAALPPAMEPAAAKPAAPATVEPELARMALATADGKIGVPVDLRYQFDGDPVAGHTVMLHLAAVPRVAGSNLAVSIKQEEGIQARAATLRVQKAGAATAYRQQVAVTRQSGRIGELRVLVTMDLPEGSAFGYFNVPFAMRAATGKQQVQEQQ